MPRGRGGGGGGGTGARAPGGGRGGAPGGGAPGGGGARGPRGPGAGRPGGGGRPGGAAGGLGGRRRRRGRRRRPAHRRHRGLYPWYPYPWYFDGYDYEENVFPDSCCADLKYNIVRCEDSSWPLSGVHVEVRKTRAYDGELWAYVDIPDQALIPGGVESGWMLVCNIPRPRYPGLRPLMRGRRSRKYLGG